MIHVPVNRSTLNIAWEMYRDNHRTYGVHGISGFYKFLDLFEPTWQSVLKSSDKNDPRLVYLPQKAVAKINVLANYELANHVTLLKMVEAKYRNEEPKVIITDEKRSGTSD